MMNGYLQTGAGPRKVMVLGGAFGSSADWSAVLEGLDLEASTYVLFDYRGYGRSLPIEGEFSFAEAAADVLRLADHLGWERFSLVGHSMGGVAIQRVMLAAPGRIERMVAIAAVPACGSRMDAQRLALFERAATSGADRKAIIDFSTGKRLPASWLTSMSERCAASSLPQAYLGYLREWGSVDFSAMVAGSPTPLKVIVGACDPALTAELMQETWLAWYRNATLEVLQNAGHYPMHETPLALAAAIDGFLLQVETMCTP